MTSTITIVLIVLFGAGLMGKMLKDLYPGSIFGGEKKTATDDAAGAE